ncbi:Beta-lactamase hydrolase-like protein [Jannaschia seosinensis]|uniref:Beta-lactamase hydrolase-like protein n=1 Tax=Jannaschia seosinensis TaxID=313367 RepID=A0A0M7BAT3_9RHOB|nr:sulfur transferase domain-containing protein [Jannaschia seosinensis]CUH35021.1 Beta-lactamase hydrolase-like protein [Jannaschia seosinensis]
MQDIVQVNDSIQIAKFAPDADALRRMSQEGVKSVVNLRTEGEKQEIGPEEERRLAEDAGLAYVHHPVAGDRISEEVVDTFREKLKDLPTPIMVHCASGKRAGALTMMHIGAEQNLSGDQTMDQARSLGLEPGSPELEAFLRSYVEGHR